MAIHALVSERLKDRLPAEDIFGLRTLVLEYGDEIVNSRTSTSVRANGALGDNLSDDTAAIQRAEDAANTFYALTGQSVDLHFPSGQYLISSSIQKRAGVHWIGKAKIRRKDNAAPTGSEFSLVAANAVNDWSIFGLYFEAVSQALSASLVGAATIGGRNSCIDARDCSRWTVAKCEMRKFGHGLIFQGAVDYRIKDNDFYSDNGKTVAGVVDNTGTDFASFVNTGAIVEHYDGDTSPNPNVYGVISGNFIENPGQDVGIQSCLLANGSQPVIVRNNTIRGPHCAIQVYESTSNTTPRSSYYAKQIIDSNWIYGTKEQGIYVRSMLGCVVTNNWIEKAAAGGSNGQTSDGAIVVRVDPVQELGHLNVGNPSSLGHLIQSNIILNFGRNATNCVGAVIIEHNHVKFLDNYIHRDETEYTDSRGSGVYVDNGKRMTSCEISRNTIFNMNRGINFTPTSFAHKYLDGNYVIEDNTIDRCSDTALYLSMTRAVPLSVRRNKLSNGLIGVYVKNAPLLVFEQNTITRMATAGVQLASGSTASNIANLISGSLIATGNRAGATQILRDNQFFVCPTPYSLLESSTNDTSISDRVAIWTGDRADGALILGHAFANASPDSSSLKSWSIGDVVLNSAPGVGPDKRVCSAPGTYQGVATTTTGDTTSGSNIVSNIASLAGWGPGMYITLSGVTGTKLITDMPVTIDRFRGDGSTTNFTLSLTPADTSKIAVAKNGTLVSSGLSLVGNVLTIATPPASADVIQVVHVAAMTLVLDSNCDATVVGSTLARAVPAFATDAYLAYSGTVTWTGSGATLVHTVTGASASDVVDATIRVKPTQAAYLVRAVPGSNNITFELSAANTSNDAQISYKIWRTT